MKWFKRIFIAILVLIVMLVAAGYATIHITPDPVAHLTRIGFSGGEKGVVYGRHPNYETWKQQIKITKDIQYSSTQETSTFDIYTPNDTSKTYPAIIWVHGGAFVGGDKRDIENFATSLTAQGYVILCMNYELAPEATYPTPLSQMSSFISELPKLAETFPIDLTQVFVGGDSAGAHIAFQFLTTQTNPEYREFMKVSQVIEPDTIKGAISLCGLLDIIRYDETDSSFSNFLYNQSAWAYFDHKDWKASVKTNGANFLPYITSDFPPTYLTDGDKDSFLDQAVDMEALLMEKQVEVSALLWKNGEHPHEYQFHLDQAAGIQNFDQLLAFLVKVINQ